MPRLMWVSDLGGGGGGGGIVAWRLRVKRLGCRGLKVVIWFRVEVLG